MTIVRILRSTDCLGEAQLVVRPQLNKVLESSLGMLKAPTIVA